MQANQHVNVVGDSADAERLHVVFSRDTAEIRKHARTKFGTQELFPANRAEHTVDEDTRVGMCHSIDSSVPFGDFKYNPINGPSTEVLG